MLMQCESGGDDLLFIGLCFTSVIHVALVYMYFIRSNSSLGPVVQTFVSLMSLLLSKCPLHKQIHSYFLLLKCENPLPCKGFSHFINKK